ncbi:MAG: flagellar hook-associated protein FlgK [Planctomycetota bacterium]
MSLFASLNLARLSLGAHQAAIQTVGQNIANANTEGYARQRVLFTPTPSDDLVFARVGTGVQIARIERIVDEHLETTVREATTDLGLYQERDRIYSMVEAVFGDLDGGGLSAALGRFFDSLEDWANSPFDPTARGLVIEEGRTLTETVNFMDRGIRDLRQALDEDFVGVVQDINRLSVQIADLNRSIMLAEDGGASPDTANDLRTLRAAALGELSGLIDIRVVESRGGAVQVVTGSDVLVQDSRARTLELRSISDGDILRHEARFTDDGKRLTPRSGRLAGIVEGRDATVADLRGQLDQIAQAFLVDFNVIHASGEGLERYGSLLATHATRDRNAPLVSGALPFAVGTGSFQFQVYNEGNDTRETYAIAITADTTLLDLAAQIDAIGADHPEISAQVTLDGHLQIESAADSIRFTFREDTTGFLAAAGLGTFFTGTNARDLGVSTVLDQNRALLASGRTGDAGDNSVVLELLALRDQGVVGPHDETIEGFYQSLIGRIGVEGAEARDLARNQDAITANVRNQREALSGVNVDEEAIQLIQLQRAYQGSARFLSVVDSLLDTLINSV